MLRYIISGFIGIFISLNMNAGIIAGEIFYKWLNGYTYEVKLCLYSEIGSASLPERCQDTIDFGDGTSAVVLRSNGPIAGCSPAHDGIPITPYIKYSEYIATHTYPGAGTYYIHNSIYTKRDSSIINIPNSINQDLHLEAMLVIPSFGVTHNTSPNYNNIPILDGCLNGNCFNFNSVGNDADGDSLSYEILPCSGVSGYTYPNAGTSGTYSIQATNGLLSWCNPQFQGKYNTLINIKQWQNDSSGNYQLIGYSQRDVRFVVNTCTGIHDVSILNEMVTVSPNPFLNEIKIQFNQTNNVRHRISLLDVTGRILTSYNSYDTEHLMTINLSPINLSKGIYFLKINDEKGNVLFKKIMKQ